MSITTEGIANTETYQARSNAKRKIDTSKGPRALLTGAVVSSAPEPVENADTVTWPDGAVTAPTPTPVLTEEEKAENYRRVAAGAKNTLVTINPDGTRSYKHDVVNRGDGMIDALRTDRGEGTRDSLKLLREEGKVKVDGLLVVPKTRDASRRFKGKS